MELKPVASHARPGQGGAMHALPRNPGITYPACGK
jgi:hypothetical protein